MAEGDLRTAPAARFESVDVEETRSVLNKYYYPLSVGVPDGAEGFAFHATVIPLGPLTVGRLGFRAPVTLVAAELDAYHVTIATAGRLRARHAGHEVVTGPVTGVVFGPGRPVYTTYEADAAELSVKIGRSALENELAALLGRPVDGPIDLAPVIDLDTGPARSWRRLVELVSAENHPGSLIQQPLIAEQLRRSVLQGLLLSVRHRYSDELHDPAPAEPPPRALQRVIDAIEDEPERSFTVGDLAVIAGVSVRSLQEGFRRHAGTTPMAYLQSVRLGYAHEALRREDPARITVAAVAHRSGFAHLGRFASIYRARYGVCPSETLRRTS